MKLSQFDYFLPKKFIAQSPASPRDSSRLMIVNRKTKSISHQRFFELPNILSANDVLVFNDTKVFPARLIGKKNSGGKAEILLLKKLRGNLWEAITKPGFSKGEKIYFPSFFGKITERHNYTSFIEFSIPAKLFLKKINEIGTTPLPPYIKSQVPDHDLRKQYQTVYAREPGSAAAPTAGLHFTKNLIAQLKDIGVQIEFLTLHVGLGTFVPIKVNDISKHKIHSEQFTLEKSVADRLNKAKLYGKRIIAVGTTTCRVLETCAQKVDKEGSYLLIPQSGSTDIYIYPGYKFRFIDSLITNFHLPKSTLLALISTYATLPNSNEKFTDFSKSLAGKAYHEAINKGYRFFSFGDAMFLT
ncbi:tRNA preQ1(34) S-adenosylmethionine ribosyltransferase-isomerase QueA [Candidatus Woesebacteria bacterium RIFCSPLOWO2_01_FULL_37_19]|uniref:S-adenosylmethionine:tRNA ribosyltransferase-isomerase n=2 Tax=Candidatus Woeseibacteriota TaxID=1752722 RepID=A0A1F8BAN6_9BACT|nr:MAG: tRNA preQ1(34) S-adenosylmethionine ribosyltransferase-isomerase QueA [Candidatus Woesebacteria bacterium RIFCSPHIGHO2_01_FULL_38_26b]OGM61112.1 MAG: tRNA preQ1(34) S-adenosylmethionine ribosyltransferase-isomerase QueA [Candidatus Woesebacteria bacterium RIFCSPLOWO2_01_FULL_37_19]